MLATSCWLVEVHQVTGGGGSSSSPPPPPPLPGPPPNPGLSSESSWRDRRDEADRLPRHGCEKQRTTTPTPPLTAHMRRSQSNAVLDLRLALPLDVSAVEPRVFSLNHLGDEGLAGVAAHACNLGNGLSERSFSFLAAWDEIGRRSSKEMAESASGERMDEAAGVSVARPAGSPQASPPPIASRLSLLSDEVAQAKFK
ncbi:hypothetical protein M427DRAFT_36745 [Gonapodya prolifera JEL478]|uniref:Uncharacterized protein n=1 Tax=Gonapodya prolifera (strain JEL478) TaxID=1344416 RepID=A0A139A1V7_GONPJ|nr:hypothetical protein M427DRAFT_36745 [Gonapodya prolifera JEL478]|eukprot:KXS10752.1 hypothetical protein M427DRAFT_36745 [Gonapodya prolifera JEL478]